VETHAAKVNAQIPVRQFLFAAKQNHPPKPLVELCQYDSVNIAKVAEISFAWTLAFRWRQCRLEV
jgi:hypothetical protein